MDRNWKDLLKILAAAAALIGAVTAAVLLIVKYKEEIGEFFAGLKAKCPCARCEEDDYADEELNCICDMDEMQE